MVSAVKKQYIYETVDEVSTRLVQCVFMYKGATAYCDAATMNDDGKLMLRCSFWPRELNKPMEYIELDAEGLEFFKYNIGYMNTSYGASYMTRLPAKGAYKQGLHRHNTHFTRISGDLGTPELNGFFKTAEFNDMLNDKYPSFAEAMAKAKEYPGRSFAFHRYFAVSVDSFRGDTLLHYKGDRVGFGVDGFQLPIEYRYLREVIIQSGIKVQ